MVTEITTKFDVDLPEAGAGAVLRFNMAKLEVLEAIYGPTYFSVVLEGLQGSRISVLSKCLEIATVGGDWKAALSAGLTVEALSERVLDALLGLIRGKTFTQIRDEDEARRGQRPR